MPLTVNPAWDEQSIFTSHLIDRLFSFDQDPAAPQSVPWILVFLRAKEEDVALSSTSFRALATAYFAKVHRQSEIMRKGAGYYARALHALRTQLQDPQLVLGDDVLVAIICLGLYELVSFTQPRGWLQHYKGLARLVGVALLCISGFLTLPGCLEGATSLSDRGGSCASTYAEIMYCKSLADLHLISSYVDDIQSLGYVVERKRCFLEDSEWKTVPWEIHGLESKTPTDQLHDMLSHIPGFLEDMDRLVTWPPGRPGVEEHRAAYGKKVFATLEELYSWRWAWEERFPNASYLISPKDLDPRTSQPLPASPFESIIWFHDSHRASDLMTYNAIRLITTRALENAGVQLDVPLSSSHMAGPLMPMEGTRHDVAVEICRMTDYHLHYLRRSSGALTLLFPFNVAYLHLDGDRDGARPWLEAVMTIVADSHGFEVGRRENMPRTRPVVRPYDML